MKRITLFLLLAVVLSGYAAAQSNDFMDALLAEESISFSQAAYLVLVASDNLGEDADEVRAFELLESLGWAQKSASPDSDITLAQYSALIMRAFDMRGSLMYRLIPAPRYAYRQLTHNRIINWKADPSNPVNGLAAFGMVGRTLDLVGANQ